MPANIVLVVERMFDQSSAELFRAWTEPGQMAQWRGSPGWHAARETVTSELRLSGRHHHIKVRDDDPSVQVTTDAVITEFFDPDVFVARQTISGDPGITTEPRWSFGWSSSRPVATAPSCASSRARMTRLSLIRTARLGA